MEYVEVILKKVIRNKNELSQRLINVIKWIVLPNIFLIVYIFLYSIITSDIETTIANAANFTSVLLTFSVPLFLFYAVMPVLWLKFRKRIKFKEIGLTYNFSFLSSTIIIGSIIVLGYIILRLKTSGHLDEQSAFIVHYFFVGLSEEILTRGVMFYELKKVFSKHFVVFIASLIFAFIFHSNADMMANLIWRFPVGLILGYVYLYTKNIYASIFLHWVYDVFVTTLNI